MKKGIHIVLVALMATVGILEAAHHQSRWQRFLNYFKRSSSTQSASKMKSAPEAQPTAQGLVVAWDIDDVLLHDGRPCSSAFDVVRQLRKKGVRQVLFTNKSQNDFKKLQAKHPDFFNHGYFDIARSVIGGRHFEKKPYAPNYKTILKHNAGNRVIFFDDKEKNIVAAKTHGMDAHVWVYNCRKSAHHARSVLHKQGLI